MHNYTLIYVLLAVVISAVLVKVLSPIADRIGLVDHPCSRKLHQYSVPLIGGVAIFLSIVFTMMFMQISLQPYRSLFLGGGLLVLVGVLDDMHDISARTRMVMQILAAVSLVVPGGLLLSSFGNILDVGHPVTFNHYFAILLTVFAVLAMTNAMNMLDGQDGLLGGIAMIQVGWLAALCMLSHLHKPYYFLLIVIGAIAGFLVYNYRWPWLNQAIVFMGDAGSTFLGFLCAWFAIYLSQSHYLIHTIRPVAFLWVLAFPLLDISGAIFRRFINKKSPLRPDRGHLHHVIEKLGITVDVSTPALYLFSFLCGAYGVLGEFMGLSDVFLFNSFLVLLFVYIIFVTIINRALDKPQEA